jgi:microcystin-dependent protein
MSAETFTKNLNTFHNSLYSSMSYVTAFVIPHGSIVAYNGFAPIPVGWAECNGENGTPDLRGRFIIAVGQGDGLTNRELDDIGGTETHTLSAGEMPVHTHVLDANGSHTHTIDGVSNHNHGGSTGAAGHATSATDVAVSLTTTAVADDGGSHTHTISDDGAHTHTMQAAGTHGHTLHTSGDGLPHNNMPPFYALIYIMKI